MYEVAEHRKLASLVCVYREANLAITLFIPAGWWHWVQGDAECEWHVAWGGSFFPPSSFPVGTRY